MSIIYVLCKYVVNDFYYRFVMKAGRKRSENQFRISDQKLIQILLTEFGYYVYNKNTLLITFLQKFIVNQKEKDCHELGINANNLSQYIYQMCNGKIIYYRNGLRDLDLGSPIVQFLTRPRLFEQE